MVETSVILVSPTVPAIVSNKYLLNEYLLQHMLQKCLRRWKDARTNKQAPQISGSLGQVLARWTDYTRQKAASKLYIFKF